VIKENLKRDLDNCVGFIFPHKDDEEKELVVLFKVGEASGVASFAGKDFAKLDLQKTDVSIALWVYIYACLVHLGLPTELDKAKPFCVPRFLHPKLPMGSKN